MINIKCCRTIFEYFEKSKYKFYSELSNNIQFEYSVVPPLLTLSKKDALLLNIEPKIIDPLSNEKVTKDYLINHPRAKKEE